jgi:hypothetical protein
MNARQWNRRFWIPARHFACAGMMRVRSFPRKPTCFAGAAIAVLGVKVEPLRGRFANLDPSARRWLFSTMSFW